ncbi:glycoside hydrolase [Phaeosphaeriaceae sp. SRC1lsM3a]|nr:glycoside hydrolase [Stagonospora sp. SRC1lsM3a]
MRINPSVIRWLTFFFLHIIAIAEPFVPIASWRVVSSARVVDDAAKLSTLGIDTSRWYRLNASKGTLMATLIASGVYNEMHLFNSTNLQNVDLDQFRVPWYYRSEFKVEKHDWNRYHTLRTNGISSRADIYLNGYLVADKNTQVGAYSGLEYDISNKLYSNDTNVLLVKVYPTDYNRDFALGFVDWNPYPPDNGTGVWRDVELKRTGQVSLSTPRINTKLDGSITVHLDVKNLAQNATASGLFWCTIFDPKDGRTDSPAKGFDIAPGGQSKLKLQVLINDPQIWWPRQWGKQPLYSVQCKAATSDTSGISDSTPRTNFGIRTVSSSLDFKHNDTTFYVNGERFQVIGAGYTSDIFLRFDESKLRAQFQYVLDMGLNTVRLEGKQEHPRLYSLADDMGIMLLAGWECCDKWEGWTYNDEGSGEKWVDADYSTANLSMRHEAEMIQSHPSMLGFLIGSDFWPDDRATKIYVDALRAFDWDVPVLSSASQRGAPTLIGNGGMKMEGPYDWVPPNYWYDPSQRLGSAGGFGSELGAGVGTPPLSSLQRFLSPDDLTDLWKEPNKGLYHMSTNVSSFYTREIYNTALWARFGAPTSLSDYLMKAAMMDYEATKAQFEAYISRWDVKLDRPATGLIYWMLNNAWPSLHWNLFDYYLQPGPAYFGVKAAVGKMEHVIYDYETKAVHLVNRGGPSTERWPGDSKTRVVQIEIMDLRGEVLGKHTINATRDANIAAYIPEVETASKVVLLRLVLTSEDGVLSRNTYWLSPTLDQLDWDSSTWYHTPVSKYADLGALSDMAQAELDVTAVHDGSRNLGEKIRVTLQNKSKIPAVFVRLSLVDAKGDEVAPVLWSENYVTLWANEKMDIEVEYEVEGEGLKLQVEGRNVGTYSIAVRTY